jgi:hypothetical protein
MPPISAVFGHDARQQATAALAVAAIGKEPFRIQQSAAVDLLDAGFRDSSRAQLGADDGAEVDVRFSVLGA